MDLDGLSEAHSCFPELGRTMPLDTESGCHSPGSFVASRRWPSYSEPCRQLVCRRLDASTTLPAATKISRVLRSFWKREVQRTLGSGQKTLSRS